MKTKQLLLAALLIYAAGVFPESAARAAAPETRTRTRLNFDWKFHLGDAVGAQESGFNDAGWQPVNLPHDWVVS